MIHVLFPGSTALESAQFDPVTETVTITFRQRGSYDFDCSPSMWAAFMAAPSKGRFVNQVWVERV